jgi:lipopolysaccharide export system protein LptC
MKNVDALSEKKLDGETISGARDFIGSPSFASLKFNSRYSHFVAVIKFILLGLAILLVGLAFVLPNLEQEEGFTLDYADVTLSDDSLTMKNPRFAASDLSNQYYVVTADTATQQTTNDPIVVLSNLQADITLKSGDWISLSAPDGELNTETGYLKLFGEINIFSDSGNELTANSAEADLKKRIFTSDQPFKGHGPLGTIEADRLAVDQNSGNLRFESNVKLRVNP